MEEKTEIATKEVKHLLKDDLSYKIKMYQYFEGCADDSEIDYEEFLSDSGVSREFLNDNSKWICFLDADYVEMRSFLISEFDDYEPTMDHNK